MAYEQVKRYAYYDSDETNRVFGLTPKPADETMRDALAWLLHIGAIKRSLSTEVMEGLEPECEWVSG